MSAARCMSFVVLLAFLSGCTSQRGRDSSNAQRSTAWLREARSLDVQESSDIFLGSLVYAARAADGVIVASDTEHARVLKIDQAGRVHRLFGQRGSGPGEFRSGGAIGMLSGDSILGATDGLLRRLYVYDLRADSVIRTLTLPWPEVGGNWNVRGDSLTMAITVFSRALLSGDWRSGELRAFGSVSARIKTDMFTVLQHGRPEVLRMGSQTLAVFPAEDGAHLIDSSGERMAYVPLPTRFRRGVPSTLFAEAAKRQSDRDNPKAIEPVGSMIMGLHRLETGHVLVVFMDVDQIERAKPEAPVRGLYGNYRFYLTLLDPDLSRACVDAEVRLRTDIVPVPFFRGDSMFVIEKAVLANDSVQTRIRSFTILPTQCEPSPLGAMEPARAAQ